MGSTSSGRKHYRGVEVRFWVLPQGAAVPDDVNYLGYQSESSTTSPWQHTFTGYERGMDLYLTMRWENKSLGKNPSSGKGPWGAMQNVVIP
jgi:hypothetical protein